MSHIIEFLTVNLAVDDPVAVVDRYRSLGLSDLPPNVMPEMPIAMTDITMDIPGGVGLSIIFPQSPGVGPVGKFLAKRGQGVYSIALRVDDIEATMRDWSAAGLRWASPQPVPSPDGRAARYIADTALLNWALPQELGGVLVEIVELRGNVRLDDTIVAR
jgi:hypothetical protein